jgi:hypothetical protein
LLWKGNIPFQQEEKAMNDQELINTNNKPEDVPTSADLLMQEYRLRLDEAHNMLSQTWRMGAILLAAAIGVFGFVALQGGPDLKSLLLAIIVGLISSRLITMWVQMMDRWRAFAQVSYYRAREIEAELGLWGGRYIHYLDHNSAPAGMALSEGEQTRLKRLQAEFAGGFPKERVSDVARRLPSLFATVWIAWIVYQMLWFLLVKISAAACLLGPGLGRAFETIVLNCQ